jgi:hypothetical protein
MIDAALNLGRGSNVVVDRLMFLDQCNNVPPGPRLLSALGPGKPAVNLGAPSPPSWGKDASSADPPCPCNSISNLYTCPPLMSNFPVFIGIFCEPVRLHQQEVFGQSFSEYPHGFVD